MKTILPPLCLGFAAVAMLTLFSFASATAQTTYSGNGATGFGGTVGNGSLAISEDSSGMLTFTANQSGGNGTFNGNDFVVYIDSHQTTGFGSTGSFSDANDATREGVSGYNPNNGGTTAAPNPTRTLLNFPTGFNASYALAFDGEGNNVVLYQLAAGGNNSLVYITSATPANNIFTISFPATSIGLTMTATNSFNFVGSLINDAAYRSNETIGMSTTTPGTSGDAPNAGSTGTTTFTTFDTFPVPEPATWAMMVGGFGVLAGAALRCRRV